MADKFEQWREADRRAHQLECWVRTFGSRSNFNNIPRPTFLRAKELRAQADKLFPEAMREMREHGHPLAGWPPRGERNS